MVERGVWCGVLLLVAGSAWRAAAAARDSEAWVRGADPLRPTSPSAGKIDSKPLAEPVPASGPATGAVNPCLLPAPMPGTPHLKPAPVPFNPYAKLAPGNSQWRPAPLPFRPYISPAGPYNRPVVLTSGHHWSAQPPIPVIWPLPGPNHPHIHLKQHATLHGVVKKPGAVATTPSVSEGRSAEARTTSIPQKPTVPTKRPIVESTSREGPTETDSGVGTADPRKIHVTSTRLPPTSTFSIARTTAPLGQDETDLGARGTDNQQTLETSVSTTRPPIMATAFPTRATPRPGETGVLISPDGILITPPYKPECPEGLALDNEGKCRDLWRRMGREK